MAQILAGLDPALNVGGSRGSGASNQDAAVADDISQGQFWTTQPGVPTQSRVEGPQDSGLLLGAAFCELEESGVHPTVHQRGLSRVTGVRSQQLEEEARYIGLTLNGTHALHTELHLQFGNCGESREIYSISLFR